MPRSSDTARLGGATQEAPIGLILCHNKHISRFGEGRKHRTYFDLLIFEEGTFSSGVAAVIDEVVGAR